jgi:hypothetical protein
MAARAAPVLKIVRRSAMPPSQTRGKGASGRGRSRVPVPPSYGILALAEPADLLLIDDRFLNQYPHMGHEGRVTPIITTLDLLDHLVAEGVISDADRLAHRTTLRQCGYQIIPVTEAEVRTHLMAAPVTQNGLVETAELKAIRESLLRARMAKLVQPPQELPALHETQTALVRVIHEVWLVSPNETEAVARADWLLRHSDIRVWAPSRGRRAILRYLASPNTCCSSPPSQSARAKRCVNAISPG